MPIPGVETQVRVASEAADRFVEYYYEALNKLQRAGGSTSAAAHQLSQFYVSASPKLTGAGLKPDISINGHACSSLSEFQDLLEKQGTPVYYEVQSSDAHPINPHFILGSTDPEVQSEKGDKLSFSVQVGGTVKFGRGEESQIRAFNDAFVLVPHWESQARSAPRGLRRWLVVSQNTRYL